MTIEEYHEQIKYFIENNKDLINTKTPYEISRHFVIDEPFSLDQELGFLISLASLKNNFNGFYCFSSDHGTLSVSLESPSGGGFDDISFFRMKINLTLANPLEVACDRVRSALKLYLAGYIEDYYIGAISKDRLTEKFLDNLKVWFSREYLDRWSLQDIGYPLK